MPDNHEPLLASDKYNQRLVENVRPSTWTNPKPAGRYNLVVIGAGTAGLVTAAGAAGLGAQVALIERNLMGGDCLNFGCVPSKALIRSAGVASIVRHASEFGVKVPGSVECDFQSAMERMRRLRAEISSHDSAARFRKLGVDVFLGTARFVDSDTVDVDGQRLRFRRAVVATGARAAAPAVPGIDSIDYLTNETVFSLTQRPDRLAVLGAGPIGCELAQVFARFGAKVVLIETEHGVLPKEEQDAAAVVQQALEEDGVVVRCCGRQLQIRNNDGIHLSLRSHDATYEETVDHLLVAAGRKPNIEGLGLDQIGVDYDEKGVKVNDRLQTTNPRVFAAGDVCSKYQFTHAADFMARIVLQNALFFGRKRLSSLVIPWCTYTSPELAHVGMTLREAKAQESDIRTFVQPFSEIDRAIVDGESRGFVRVLVKPRSDQIVGATVVGAHAGELISEIALAMTHGVGLSKMGNVVHPYPTYSEAIRKLGDQYNRTRLTPFVKKMFQLWMEWTR